MTLTAGKHELLIGVAPVDGEKVIRWTMGIADKSSNQWLTHKMCKFSE